jgi:hypothetical protein
MIAVLSFATALVVSQILDRQRQNQRLEMEHAFDRLGWIIPPEKPRVPLLEGLVNIVLGIGLTLLGGKMVQAVLELPDIGVKDQVAYLAAIFFGAGIVLLIVGSKAVHDNIAFQRAQRMKA